MIGGTVPSCATSPKNVPAVVASSSVKIACGCAASRVAASD